MHDMLFDCSNLMRDVFVPGICGLSTSDETSYHECVTWNWRATYLYGEHVGWGCLAMSVWPAWVCLVMNMWLAWHQRATRNESQGYRGCSTPQHIAMRWKTLEHSATHSTHCNTLLHTATHIGNTLQHTFATHCNTRALQAMDLTGTAAAAHTITIQFWSLGGTVLLALSTVAAILVPFIKSQLYSHVV